jgi:ribonuclease BN (tRNA processing enzyme)
VLVGRCSEAAPQGGDRRAALAWRKYRRGEKDEKDSEVNLTVVGTGTASLRLRRRQSCVVVETGAETLVFDLGFRAVGGMRRAGIHPLGVDRVFFTHFHGDHTVDVVPFLFWRRFGAGDAGRATPLRTFSVSGPEPFLRFWRWRSRSWGRWLLGGYPAEISELPRGRGGSLQLAGCALTWAPSDHRPESIAYRLDSDRGSFVYTGDTGYARSVVELARGADTILIDCTFPDDRPFPGHLTPTGVARIASEADVGRVILTHISSQAERLDLVSEVARGYAGEVIVAEDGLRLDV